jgi:hypothetical protein
VAVEQNEQRRRAIGMGPGLGADETLIGKGGADRVQRMVSTPDRMGFHHVLGFAGSLQRESTVQCGDRPLHVHEAHHLGFRYPETHCIAS